MRSRSLCCALSAVPSRETGDESCKPHAVAENRDSHQRALEKNRGATGNEWQQDWRVEIGDVIRHEDARCAAGDLFKA